MATKKKSKKAASGRRLVTLSEVARKFKVSRQSTLSWARTHDSFPAPLIANKLSLDIDGETYTVRDPHGKIALYDEQAILEWHAEGHLRVRNGSKTAKGKKKTTAKKATTGKKSTTKKSTAKKSVKKTATDKPAKKVVKKKGKKKAAASKMAREARKAKG